MTIDRKRVIEIIRQLEGLKSMLKEFIKEDKERVNGNQEETRY